MVCVGATEAPSQPLEQGLRSRRGSSVPTTSAYHPRDFALRGQLPAWQVCRPPGGAQVCKPGARHDVALGCATRPRLCCGSQPTRKGSPMECPTCHLHSQSHDGGGCRLDVCRDGCGGIWFDAFELRKLDEPNEYTGDELLDLSRAADVTLDQTVRYKCPHCPDHVVMMRHFFSAKRGVTVDECPECGGHWLDAGELRRNPRRVPRRGNSAPGRRAVLQRGLRRPARRREGGERRGARAGAQVRQHLRFICPSYYIPGNQEWGAFEEQPAPPLREVYKGVS